MPLWTGKIGLAEGPYRQVKKGPLPGTAARAAPVPGDPAGHGPEDGCRHVQAGTMGHGELLGKRSGVFGEIHPCPPELVLPSPPGPPPAPTRQDRTSSAIAGEKTSILPVRVRSSSTNDEDESQRHAHRSAITT